MRLFSHGIAALLGGWLLAWGVIGCATTQSAVSARSPSRTNERMTALQKQADMTLPLQEKMPPVAPGEWRSYWHENDEAPQHYAASRPAVRTERRTTLYIQPLGNFTDRQLRNHEIMKEFLEIYFGSPVVMLPTLRQNDLPMRMFKKRGGEMALKVIDYTDKYLKPRLPQDAWGIMTVTSFDLYKNDGITGLYGDTLLFGRAGVISWYHLKDDLSLMLKGVSHETSHMLTLRHCQRFLCNLNGRIGLDEFRRSPLWLCPECMAKLAYATSVDMPRRYAQLASFCQKYGLTREANY